ncbi:MAG: nickel-responsive transcriptional regulator NikR [Candidatus Latescibacterota bacterium]|jgi:CopG family nickel-responsive transcriptional regulator|nr:MAG: nickel-responsive transcriptional regulator NikR [Candidatus Latescibacterota bacterium]
MKTTRFGVSMDGSLLAGLDALVRRKRYPNRSEAIRDLVRGALVEREWDAARGDVIGVLVIVYDHRRRELSSQLLTREHRHPGGILTTLHLHLDRDNCLETKVIRGKPAAVRAIADELMSMKGVKYGRLIPATAGKKLR